MLISFTKLSLNSNLSSPRVVCKLVSLFYHMYMSIISYEDQSIELFESSDEDGFADYLERSIANSYTLSTHVTSYGMKEREALLYFEANPTPPLQLDHLNGRSQLKYCNLTISPQNICLNLLPYILLFFSMMS